MFEDGDDFDYGDLMVQLDVFDTTHKATDEYIQESNDHLLSIVKPIFNFTGAEHVPFTELMKAYRSVNVDILMLDVPMTCTNVVSIFGENVWLRTNIKLPLAISKALHGEVEDGEA